MTPEEAGPRFVTMLEAAGLDPEQLDLRSWPVFQEFAAISIEGLDPDEDRDRLVFEAYVAPPMRRDGFATAEPRRGPERFKCLFDRQLHLLDASGDYLGTQSLVCFLEFDIGAGNPPRAAQLVGRGGPRHASVWAADVAAHPSFRAAADLRLLGGFFRAGHV